MKKNSGQVLIIFIIMIPILVSFIAIIAEAGYMFSLKNKYTNISKEAITYALKSDEVDIDKIAEAYVKANLSNYTDLTVTKNDGNIRLILIKKQNSIFTNLIKEFQYTIKIDYVGTIQNDKIIIKE